MCTVYNYADRICNVYNKDYIINKTITMSNCTVISCAAFYNIPILILILIYIL